LQIVNSLQNAAKANEKSQVANSIALFLAGFLTNEADCVNNND